MDKLQWFKFTPSDWMMGKIQRCPEVTQSRFIRLCCLYWNKQCELTEDDAEIEIDKEHLEILVKKKIVSLNDGFLNISFLDEQFMEIEETADGKRKSGLIGNLKRWHPEIYKRFANKEIGLEQAIELSQSVADQSHTDCTPIADPSQNIADKKRGEQIREEKKRKDNIPSFEIFLDYAKEKKPKVDEQALRLKYEAWVENDWKDGNDKVINKWRTKLLHTLPHIKEAPKESPKWNGGNTESGILI